MYCILSSPCEWNMSLQWVTKYLIIPLRVYNVAIFVYVGNSGWEVCQILFQTFPSRNRSVTDLCLLALMHYHDR